MKRLHITFTVILLVLTGIAASFFYMKNYAPGKVKLSGEALEEARNILFNKVLIDPVLVISGDTAGTEYTARLPVRFTQKSIEAVFHPLTGFSGVKINVTETKTKKNDTINIAASRDRVVFFKAGLIKSKKPKIAIIIDDWGYKAEPINYFAGIKQVFTAAVLPGLVYSEKSAVTARAQNKEVILHSPMQPKKNIPVEKLTIKADMSDAEITALITKQLLEIPEAKGVNNHEGSLVTEDPRAVTAVMRVLKKENMFFVDSLTTGHSVAGKKAKALGVLSNKRDIFIDNEKKETYISGQLMKLKKVAGQRGYAIGIGHANDGTLKALSDLMPRLEAEGFEFVYAAELVF